MLQRCEYAPYEILQIETMKVFLYLDLNLIILFIV